MMNKQMNFFFGKGHPAVFIKYNINSLNTGLNPICHLQALLEAQHILYISRTRVKMI
jgi:hypothetical protein